MERMQLREFRADQGEDPPLAPAEPETPDWLRQRTKAPARPKRKSKAGKRKKKRR